MDGRGAPSCFFFSFLQEYIHLFAIVIFSTPRLFAIFLLGILDRIQECVDFFFVIEAVLFLPVFPGYYNKREMR
jgi:hypothetical protein